MLTFPFCTHGSFVGWIFTVPGCLAGIRSPVTSPDLCQTELKRHQFEFNVCLFRTLSCSGHHIYPINLCIASGLITTEIYTNQHFSPTGFFSPVSTYLQIALARLSKHTKALFPCWEHFFHSHLFLLCKTYTVILFAFHLKSTCICQLWCRHKAVH